jgi:hypothetical protein
LQVGVEAHLRLVKNDGDAAEFAEIIKTFLKEAPPRFEAIGLPKSRWRESHLPTRVPPNRSAG